MTDNFTSNCFEAQFPCYRGERSPGIFTAKWLLLPPELENYTSYFPVQLLSYQKKT
jgi:hypothetical protein